MSQEEAAPSPKKRHRPASSVAETTSRWGVKRTSAYLTVGRPWAAVGRYWEGVVAGDYCLETLVLSAVGKASPVSVPEELEARGAGCEDSDEDAGERAAEQLQRKNGQGAAGWRPQRFFRVCVAYLGLAYGGWAWQPAPGHRSVQGQLQLALAAVCEGRRPRLACSGRTDAGVSAAGQVFSFYTLDQNIDATTIACVITEAVAAVPVKAQPDRAETVDVIPQDPNSSAAASDSRRARKAARKAERRAMRQAQQPGSTTAVASCRGPTLRVVSCERATDGFHATSAARWRRYVYVLPRRQVAAAGGGTEIRGEMAKCPDISAESISAFLQPLVQAGRLDFTAFARSNGRQTGDASTCRLLRCRVGATTLPCGAEVILIELVGTRFLRQMVRVLVATAVREAAKRAELEMNPPKPTDLSVITAYADYATDNDELLRYAQLPNERPALSISEIRAATAPPAPAVGLCFASVGYE